jgi:hypothetical protein
MKSIHLETTIRTVFGVVDDEGNVVSRHPIDLQLPFFRQEAYVEAFQTTLNNRNSLDTQIEKKESEDN